MDSSIKLSRDITVITTCNAEPRLRRLIRAFGAMWLYFTLRDDPVSPSEVVRCL
ncbi:hypothetical protein ALQ79_200641 [Pseudomonas amygdali pv. lachrymans]|nr:hypothetical protein ALQ79_200641 [Pseudomonas amygdali pv. lachrymans]